MKRNECLERLSASRPLILPSMLLCDFANLEQEIRRTEAAGYKMLHLDVMDGTFVPNMTYGMTIVEAVKRCTDLIIDVHLMIVNPEKYLTQFRQAGADVITVHAEATDNLAAALCEIRELDAVAGVAINPQTEVAEIEPALDNADLVLPMSVQPGFGGQSFDESVLPKFGRIREIAGQRMLLQIDGGINTNTIGAARQAGVDLFVAGSAVFKTDDYQQARHDLHNAMGDGQ